MPSTPGARYGQELGAAVTSRKWRPRPAPASGDAVSIVGGTYRLNGSGSWVSTPGTWGSAKYIEVRCQSDTDEYLTDTTATTTIDGVDYVFTVTTKADPASLNNAFPYEFPFILE